MIRNLADLTPRKLVILPYLHERKLHLNKRDNTNQFYTMIKSPSGIMYILCLCINDNKMYVYGENSILVRRFTYEKIANKCGKPICVSEDGLSFVFQTSDLSNVIYIVQLSIDGLRVKKKIDIKAALEDYVAGLRAAQDPKHDKISEFYNIYLGECVNFKNIKKQFCMNDNQDILIRLKPKEEFINRIRENQLIEEAFEKDERSGAQDVLTDCSLFYF